ncbi:MAG TPA: hypothetical protein VFC68_00120 [Treponemataceae bacterium]|nr:hypothetical protein [Treponemataceae bacterium]
MAIQPIDLQTMYASLAKVSKKVAFDQQGLQLKKSMNEDLKTQKQAEEQQTVQKTKDQENIQAVSENNEHTNSGQEMSSEKKESENNKQTLIEDTKEYEKIKDLTLGRHIDVSG